MDTLTGKTVTLTDVPVGDEKFVTVTTEVLGTSFNNTRVLGVEVMLPNKGLRLVSTRFITEVSE